jgi:hypothetical protein
MQQQNNGGMQQQAMQQMNTGANNLARGTDAMVQQKLHLQKLFSHPIMTKMKNMTAPSKTSGAKELYEQFVKKKTALEQVHAQFNMGNILKTPQQVAQLMESINRDYLMLEQNIVGMKSPPANSPPDDRNDSAAPSSAVATPSEYFAKSSPQYDSADTPGRANTAKKANDGAKRKNNKRKKSEMSAEDVLSEVEVVTPTLTVVSGLLQILDMPKPQPIIIKKSPMTVGEEIDQGTVV